jgi:Cu+-exporting ATPase
MERDLVCGMMVDPKTSRKSEYRGKTYYFCSAGCMTEFDKNPEKFIGKAEENKKKAG